MFLPFTSLSQHLKVMGAHLGRPTNSEFQGQQSYWRKWQLSGQDRVAQAWFGGRGSWPASPTGERKLECWGICKSFVMIGAEGEKRGALGKYSVIGRDWVIEGLAST